MKFSAQILGAGGILFLLPFLCNPFGATMEMQFETPKLLLAFLLGNLCFAFYLSQKIHKAFGVLHAAFALSVLLTGFGSMQLYPFAYWTAALFLALWAGEQREEAQLFLWKCVAVAGVLVSVHASLQMLGFSWPIHYAPGIEPTRPIAFLGQQTKLGAFLAPCAAVALALGWLLPSLFIAFVCLCTGSSFTVFALLVGLGTVIAQRRLPGWRWRPAFKGFVVLGVLLILVGPSFKESIPALDDHGRYAAWRDTFNAWKERPVLGYGPGGFKQLFAGPDREKDYAEENFAHSMQKSDTWRLGGGWFQAAHCDFLQVLFEMGLMGFLALLFALFSLFRAYRRLNILGWEGSVLAAQGALAALLANALGNFPWTLSPHFMIGVLAAAIVLRAGRISL